MATYDITANEVLVATPSLEMDKYYSFQTATIVALIPSLVLDFGAAAAPAASNQGPIQHWS